MIIILAIGMFCASIYMLLSGLTVKQREIAITLRKAKRYGTRDQREIETRRSVNDRIVGPLTQQIADITQKILPKADPNEIHGRLMAAGLSRSMSPQMYLALKGGLVTTALVLGIIIAASGAMPAIMGLMIALGGSALCFIAPDFYINSRVRARRELMRSELPNVLDLLCVSVEAGLGFDAAVSKLSERMEGPLVDEFGLVLHEMRIGESRSAALKSLSDRVDVPEVAQFCRAIIQADQLGIALSRILRVQSHDMRIRRQLSAEEKAMKAPVKMLFPTVVFIFPSMFVVALGPAAISLLQTFGGGKARRQADPDRPLRRRVAERHRDARGRDRGGQGRRRDRLRRLDRRQCDGALAAPPADGSDGRARPSPPPTRRRWTPPTRGSPTTSGRPSRSRTAAWPRRGPRSTCR